VSPFLGRIVRQKQKEKEIWNVIVRNWREMGVMMGIREALLTLWPSGIFFKELERG
jgi:hypothetical protein